MTKPSDSQDERRSRLLSALPAIAWSANARTFRFNYVNSAAEKILGYPEERWLNEPDFWVSHLHPDDRHVARFCHNETLACRDHELVYRMIAADGRTVWLRDYVNVHSVDGEAVELFGVMIDITREREAEAASQESRENFRRMVELSPDCIGVYVDSTYVYVNQAFVQLLGANSESEILGRSIFDFIDDSYQELAKEHSFLVRSGRNIPYVRSRYRRIDRSPVEVEVAALPFRFGQRDAVQVIARDISDRVRAESELQVREARLQLLASGTHEAIWEWFPDRKELWTNDAYRALIGDVSAPAMFFEDWLTRVHPDDRERASAVVRSAIDAEVPIWWHEYRLRDTEGSYRSVLDRGHAVKMPDGERRVIGALLDVTPVREAERLRAAAEAKFRWLVEQSVVAVYMMSGGRFTYINETGAEMLGYTTEELRLIDLRDLLVGNEDPDEVFGGGPNVARIRRSDGTLLHVAFYPNEVTIDGERIIVGTGADITESVRTREALEASEQRYRQLVDDVADILYALDPEGRITSLSPSFERITQHAVTDWIGRPFTDLFQPQETSPQRLGQEGRAIRDYELVTRSGSVVILEVSSEPRHVDGAVSGTIGMARDVTEHRNIARKLEETKRMSSLGQLAASLAHEFNNVLMGIQPFVEMIRRKTPPGTDINDALGHISSAIGRGKRASQEILRFAHPKTPQFSSVDPREWLPAFFGQLSATLPPSVRFTSSLAPDVPCIRGDREHLELVITNLVFNARDAIGGDGAIHIDVAAEHDNLVRISVSDNGSGIPPHMLDRIFEPLFTTKRNGTGLGLAIARRLMEGQGGLLTGTNRSEGGSVFNALVPAAELPMAAARPAPHQRPSVERILLVEDDPTVGTGLEALLNLYGYQTTWVRAAADVCEAARRSRPQVAIIDVNLPDGNGVDLVPKLRAEHHDLPVVLSTGHVELNISDTPRRILSLMKPYELEELLDAIGTVTAA